MKITGTKTTTPTRNHPKGYTTRAKENTRPPNDRKITYYKHYNITKKDRKYR